MKMLNDDIIAFFEKHHFVIVSTIDAKGRIHCAAKGIVGIDREGMIYLIDLYKARTYRNLLNNPAISITAVVERQFAGYTLKGTAQIVEREKIEDHVIKKWEDKVLKRISSRLIDSVQRNVKSSSHPETRFPPPKYLIVMTVSEIVDLRPAHLK